AIRADDLERGGVAPAITALRLEAGVPRHRLRSREEGDLLRERAKRRAGLLPLPVGVPPRELHLRLRLGQGVVGLGDAGADRSEIEDRPAEREREGIAGVAAHTVEEVGVGL